MNEAEFAVIADVHGNAWALEAVLADIAQHGVRGIVNLGDNANGPLDPARSVELLRGCSALHVRGNGDRMTGVGGDTATRSSIYARERLDEHALQWLRELPLTLMGDDWMAFHATPRSDTDYFLENIAAGKTVLAHRDEVAGRLGKTDASLILCGHTHIPRLVTLATGQIVLNPGSVGLPAYASGDPSPHVVETGSPDARYAIVRRDTARWRVEFLCVPYDWRAAVAHARAEGWEEWARNLETGYS
jgi:predicted phosphodiesterase